MHTFLNKNKMKISKNTTLPVRIRLTIHLKDISLPYPLVLHGDTPPSASKISVYLIRSFFTMILASPCYHTLGVLHAGQPKTDSTHSPGLKIDNSLKSATKFCTQEYKDERISSLLGRVSHLIQLADPHIKAKVAQEDWANALVFLMLDNYHPEPVAPDRCGLNGEDNIDSIIFKHFRFTGKDENTVTNKQLRDWLKKNGHTFSLTKLGIELEGRKAIKYRSESTRGFKRLKLMEHEPDSEVCGTPEA